VYTKASAVQTPKASHIVDLVNNRGAEALAYLKHIVDHYDEGLAERTVFLHGRRPSCGFFLTSGATGSHLMANVSMHDYLTAPLVQNRTFMPITMLLDGNLTTVSLRSSFADLPARHGRPAVVPRPVPGLPTGSDDDHWLEWEANDFHAFVLAQSRAAHAKAAKQKAESGAPSANAPRPVHHFSDFFRNVFDRPPPAVLPVAQGAQFAASPAAIRSTPKHVYEALLRAVESGEHPEYVYYLEARAAAAAPPNRDARSGPFAHGLASLRCVPRSSAAHGSHIRLPCWLTCADSFRGTT
jgi:hypothetical protein